MVRCVLPKRDSNPATPSVAETPCVLTRILVLDDVEELDLAGPPLSSPSADISAGLDLALPILVHARPPAAGSGRIAATSAVSP